MSDDHIFSIIFIVCEIFCICIAVAMCDKVHHVETIHIYFKQHLEIFEIGVMTGKLY